MNYEICSEIKLQLWVKLHLLCVSALRQYRDGETRCDASLRKGPGGSKGVR